MAAQVDSNLAMNIRHRRIIASTLLAVAVLFVIYLFSKSYSHETLAQANPITFQGHLFDAKGEKSIDDILSLIQSNNSQAPKPKNQSETASATVATIEGYQWLWFSPTQFTADMEVLFLELAWLDTVNLYFVSETNEIRSYTAGDHDKFSKRIINFRKPAFPILREVNNQRTEWIVLQISAQGRLSAPLFATTEVDFYRLSNLDHLFYGIWIAVLIAIAMYNATIFFSLRDNVYLYYIVYVMVFASLLIVATGMAQKFLWPDKENLTTLIANIALALTNAGTVFFVTRFIRLKNYSTRLNHLLNFFAYISLITIPFVFVYDYKALTPILLGSFLIMPLILPAAVIATLKDNAVAPFMLASIIILMPCNSIGLLRFMGLFETAFWGEHVAELGMAAEALILSIGLAYRVNLLRHEKDQIANEREREHIAFAKQLISVKENERKSISKALHDSIGHKILSIKTSLTTSNGQLQSDNNAIPTNTMDIIEEAIEEVRDLSRLLYPAMLEHLGLKKSIGSLISRTLDPTPFTYSYNVSDLNLTRELQLVLFRSVQECLNNLLRHSDANHFDVNISKENGSNRIMFVAQDNGKNDITANQPGFGLSMLKQYALVFNGAFSTLRTQDGNNKVMIYFQDTQ